MLLLFIDLFIACFYLQHFLWFVIALWVCCLILSETELKPFPHSTLGCIHKRDKHRDVRWNTMTSQVEYSLEFVAKANTNNAPSVLIPFPVLSWLKYISVAHFIRVVSCGLHLWLNYAHWVLFPVIIENGYATQRQIFSGTYL